MKLCFRRKYFGQMFILRILTNFHPKSTEIM
jgi:hypothetical protein